MTFLARVVPALGYAGAVFLGGTVRLPAGGGPGVDDKLVHFVAFAGMSVLLARAGLWFRPGIDNNRLAALSAVVSLSLGGILELVQALLPYRGCEWWDWVADVLGAGVGAVCVRWFPRLGGSE